MTAAAVTRARSTAVIAWPTSGSVRMTAVAAAVHRRVLDRGLVVGVRYR